MMGKLKHFVVYLAFAVGVTTATTKIEAQVVTNTIKGKVFLSDGVTPVLTAQVLPGSTTINSMTIGMASTSGLTSGMLVSGPGIPAGSTITTVNMNVSIIISQKATASSAGTVSLTFSGPATVEATDSSNSAAPFTVTYPLTPTPTNNFLISFNPASLPADKAIQLVFRLNGVVDRVLTGVDGASILPQPVLHIGLTTAGTATNGVTSHVIQGSTYYRNGTTPTPSFGVVVTATKSDGTSLLPSQIQGTGNGYAITVDPRTLPGDKTLIIRFTLNGNAVTARELQGVIANAVIPSQKVDISFPEAPSMMMEHRREHEACEPCAPCCEPRQSCGQRCGFGIFRRRCR